MSVSLDAFRRRRRFLRRCASVLCGADRARSVIGEAGVACAWDAAGSWALRTAARCICPQKNVRGKTRLETVSIYQYRRAREWGMCVSGSGPFAGSSSSSSTEKEHRVRPKMPGCVRREAASRSGNFELREGGVNDGGTRRRGWAWSGFKRAHEQEITKVAGGAAGYRPDAGGAPRRA